MRKGLTRSFQTVSGMRRKIQKGSMMEIIWGVGATSDLLARVLSRNQQGQEGAGSFSSYPRPPQGPPRVWTSRLSGTCCCRWKGWKPCTACTFGP